MLQPFLNSKKGEGVKRKNVQLIAHIRVLGNN